jgi:L-asparaginase
MPYLYSMASKAINSVLLLYTGGTAGMVRNEEGVLVPFDFEQIESLLPELQRLPFQISHWATKQPIDSSNLKPPLWNELAEVIAREYDQHIGFVILHGTDTMAYTASALSFLLSNLGKPVIITGAQLPIGDIRTDAKENILTALEIAGASAMYLPLVPEVCIYFDYSLFRGNRSIKQSSDRFDAFSSPNFPKLAEAGTHIRFFQDFFHRAVGPFSLQKSTFPNRVATLRLFPGMGKNHLLPLTTSNDWDVIILQSYGSGNAPSEPEVMDAFREATESGKVLLNTTQCTSGRVIQDTYAVGRQLSNIGVVEGLDLTLEAAVVKTMFLLGQKPFDPTSFKQEFQTNLAGEITSFADFHH